MVPGANRIGDPSRHSYSRSTLMLVVAVAPS